MQNNIMDEYQKQVKDACSIIGCYNSLSPKEKVMLHALGLAGESGEACEEVKKYVWYNNRDYTDTRKKVLAELGDVMWHVANLSSEMNITLAEILEYSSNKTKERAEKGK